MSSGRQAPFLTNIICRIGNDIRDDFTSMIARSGVNALVLESVDPPLVAVDDSRSDFLPSLTFTDLMLMKMDVSILMSILP